MIHKYTPTTDEVRDAWVYASTGGESDRTYQEAAGLFNRWLAAYEVEVRERIAQEVEDAALYVDQWDEWAVPQEEAQRLIRGGVE